MRIIQCHSTMEAVATVVSIIIERIESNPKSVIGLATGKTMVPVYAMLSEYKKDNPYFLNESFFFMLDEYFGLPVNHPSSFKNYIKLHVLKPLHLKESQIAFPPIDLKDGPAHYEKLLKESGGIDLQLLGLGRNGHVGFNEPGSEKKSRTRIVQLSEGTIEANRDQFTDVIPSSAISMGIGTILESKSLLMLATGLSKAEAVKELVKHYNEPNCPATFLREHPHFTLVLDPEASSKINLNI